MVHALRSLGSSAMNFATVAQGGLDLYWYVSVISVFVPTDQEAGKLAAGLGTLARV